MKVIQNDQYLQLLSNLKVAIEELKKSIHQSNR